MRSLGTAQIVARAGAVLGEGPRWDAADERLLWVDIEAGSVHLFEPATGRDRVAASFDSKVGAVAPWRDDKILVALASELAEADLAGGTVRGLVALPHARPGMRCNDGACDAAGRFWIGTMAEDSSPGAGALYRYDGGDRLHTMLEGVTLANGLGWDRAAERMFFIDSPTQRVDVLDFDLATGRVADRRPFAEIPPQDGIPDGLAVDDEGGVWVALYGGGEVRRFGPDGRPDARIEVPADNVTACCFAGPDGRRLYITTASQGVPPEPAGRARPAGGLFSIDVPFSGAAAHAYTGRADRGRTG
jgi:sugar lactone lactonase YvrE